MCLTIDQRPHEHSETLLCERPSRRFGSRSNDLHGLLTVVGVCLDLPMESTIRTGVAPGALSAGRVCVARSPGKYEVRFVDKPATCGFVMQRSEGRRSEPCPFIPACVGLAAAGATFELGLRPSLSPRTRRVRSLCGRPLNSFWRGCSASTPSRGERFLTLQCLWLECAMTPRQRGDRGSRRGKRVDLHQLVRAKQS